MTMTHEEITTILEAAKERLFSHGWCRLNLGPLEGPNCIMGAIYSGKGLNWTNFDADLDEVYRTLYPLTLAFQYTTGQSPVRFNDDTAKSFNDIVDAIDKTIKMLEGGKSDWESKIHDNY